MIKSRVKSVKIPRKKKQGKKWRPGKTGRSVEETGPPGEYGGLTRTLSKQEQENPLFNSKSRSSTVDHNFTGKIAEEVNSIEEEIDDESTRRRSKLAGTLGISLKVIADIVNDTRFEQHMTTADVCKTFVLREQNGKLGKKSKSKKIKTVAYAETKKKSEQHDASPCTGLPTHYVSHSWKSKFHDLYQSLVHFESGVKNELQQPYYYIDVLCEPQQGISKAHNDEFWGTKLPEFIKAIDHTISIMGPWQDPLVFQSTWCVYETYLTIAQDSVLTIAMTKEQHLNLEAALMADSKAMRSFEEVAQIENTSCWNDSDKDRLLKFVESSVGFEKVNKTVRSEVLGVLLCLAAGIGKSEAIKRLLASGASHSIRVSGDGIAAAPVFFHAVSGGHLNEAKLLVGAGIDPNSRDNDNATALHVACRWGHARILEWLLADLKLNPNIRERATGSRPLHLACEWNHPVCVRLLLDNGARFTMRRADSLQPLHVACHHGHLGCMEEVLRRCPPARFVRSRKIDPLGATGPATLARDDEVATRAGCDPFGFTPLHIAMASQEPKAVVGKALMAKLLLGHDRECANVGDIEGNTAWFCLKLTPNVLASPFGTASTLDSGNEGDEGTSSAELLPGTVSELVEQLVGTLKDSGVELSKCGLSSTGEPVLAYIAPSMDLPTLQLLQNKAGIEMNWEQWSSPGEGGLSVFHRAVLAGNFDVASHVFDMLPEAAKKKAVEETVTCDGASKRTFMHLIAKSDRFRYVQFDMKFVERVLASTKDPNKICRTKDSLGNTPLHLLKGSGKGELAQFVVDHGVDVNIKNNSKATALDVVISSTKQISSSPSQETPVTVLVQLGGLLGATSNVGNVGSAKPGDAQGGLLIDSTKLKKTTLQAMKLEMEIGIKSRPYKEAKEFARSIVKGGTLAENRFLQFIIKGFCILFAGIRELEKKSKVTQFVVEGCFGSIQMSIALVSVREPMLTSKEYMKKVTLKNLNAFRDYVTGSEEDFGPMSSWECNARALYLALRYVHASLANRLLKEEL